MFYECVGGSVYFSIECILECVGGGGRSVTWELAMMVAVEGGSVEVSFSTPTELGVCSLSASMERDVDVEEVISSYALASHFAIFFCSP